MSKMRWTGSLVLGVALVGGCSSGGEAAKARTKGDATTTAARSSATGSDGFHFACRCTSTTTGGPAGASQPPRDFSATVKIRGGKARVDFVSEMGPAMRKGSYMLVDAGAKQVMFVLPDGKRIMSMDSVGGSPMTAMRRPGCNARDCRPQSRRAERVRGASGRRVSEHDGRCHDCHAKHVAGDGFRSRWRQ